MPQILIVCDDFRIGGIQRIALDQAYELNRRGISSEILVLSKQPNPKTPTFQKNEKDLIERLGVKVIYIWKAFASSPTIFRSIKEIQL
jgi:hypothetical protein